ncbi:MAG: SocA family protein [Clostridia bacterium]|nr:SocA family protein [Clostridia bacterium]
MYSAKDIAEWFLNKNRVQMNFEDSEYITNLKLQKLLYYAQGHCLSKIDEPLFDDEFLAWEHGPVIKEVYNLYKTNGSKGIEYDKDFNIIIDDDIENILEEVYEKYGQFSAWKLRNMTHEESPWINTPRNEIIPKCEIKEYFKKKSS